MGHRLKRKNMVNWKSENNILLDILGKDVDIEQWEDSEKLFYKDQKNITRKSIVDKIHVDIDCETHILVTEQQRIDEEMQIEEFICDDENMMNCTLASEELNVNPSLNCSFFYYTSHAVPMKSQLRQNGMIIFMRDQVISRIL